MSTVDRAAQFMLKIHSDIERVGWSAVGVASDIDDPSPLPPFTYSIGFRELGHPEVIVVGLSPFVAHAIIGTVYDRVKDGERFKDGDIVDGILDNSYKVRFDALPPDGRPLNAARTYYQIDELPALQVVWPDKNGLFPGQEGFDERYETQVDIDRIREDDEQVS